MFTVFGVTIMFYNSQDPGMQAVEVLQDLGNSIAQQLDLGNSSSVAFEKVTEDLGKQYILKTVRC